MFQHALLRAGNLVDEKVEKLERLSRLVCKKCGEQDYSAC
jgi:hypothetical protein